MFQFYFFSFQLQSITSAFFKDNSWHHQNYLQWLKNVKSFYCQRSHGVNLRTEQNPSFDILDTADLIIKSFDSCTSFIVYSSQTENQNDLKKIHNIFISENFKSFQNVLHRKPRVNFDFNGFFLHSYIFASTNFGA